MEPVKKDASLKPFIWGAILFHFVLAFHDCFGVDGSYYFSAYSQYAFGLCRGFFNYYSASFSAVAIPHLMSCVLHIPFVDAIKLINALCWITCSYLAVRVCLGDRTPASRWWFVLLAFNPVAVFNIHYHVQYESLVLCLMLGGLALYRCAGSSPKIQAGVCWALAVSAKSFPALLLPLFICDRRTALREKAYFYLSCASFFLLPEIPWVCKIGWRRAFMGALSYKSLYRFGLCRIAEARDAAGALRWCAGRLLAMTDGAILLIVVGVLIAVGMLIYVRKISLFHGMGLYLALLLFLSPRNSPQYLVFVIPFLILFRNRPALIFANASYAIILVFFYLLDPEMSGSYCLLKPLSFLSISQGVLAFWEAFRAPISLYLWGYLYIVASFVFVYAYRPVGGGSAVGDREMRGCRAPMRKLAWGGLLLFWGLGFFSTDFRGNPFSVPRDGLSEVEICNRVLQPADTLGWYGTTGEYEMEFAGLKPGDAVRLSGDTYFTIRTRDRLIGPFRGDGNKYYSFWWGISYPLTYESLRESGFKVTVINYLCSIRGVNTITARLIGQGRDWDSYGHMLDGKVEVNRCRIDGIDYGVELGQRAGWLDSKWLSIRPKNFQFKGASYINIFTIILLYIIVFFVVVGGRLKMGKGER